jgi:hypothetical protein
MAEARAMEVESQSPFLSTKWQIIVPLARSFYTKSTASFQLFFGANFLLFVRLLD